MGIFIFKHMPSKLIKNLKYDQRFPQIGQSISGFIHNA